MAVTHHGLLSTGSEIKEAKLGPLQAEFLPIQVNGGVKIREEKKEEWF